MVLFQLQLMEVHRQQSLTARRVIALQEMQISSVTVLDCGYQLFQNVVSCRSQGLGQDRLYILIKKKENQVNAYKYSLFYSTRHFCFTKTKYCHIVYYCFHLNNLKRKKMSTLIWKNKLYLSNLWCYILNSALITLKKVILFCDKIGK